MTVSYRKGSWRWGVKHILLDEDHPSVYQAIPAPDNFRLRERPDLLRAELRHFRESDGKPITTHPKNSAVEQLLNEDTVSKTPFGGGGRRRRGR